MKKMNLLTFLAIIFLLTACSSSDSSNAAGAIKTMYKAALNHDVETFTRMVSDDVMDYYNPEDSMEDLRETINEAGGLAELKVLEISKDKLNEEMVKSFSEEFQNNWHFVVQDINQDEFLCWILVKGDRYYQVIYVEDLSQDEFLKESKK
ncbi:hypothetical protein [Metabacillus malikii]|uniref:DUF4878 domain-containing protein n=1 Tax=Metabacillus malikii TaxID=1504265 RepID=A0ABT9ZGH5_9BACI|nr:hypothetical protein [Metabacillus malikii]MDQ0231383.1 hypothetical protein [Metabacillus malikii]